MRRLVWSVALALISCAVPARQEQTDGPSAGSGHDDKDDHDGDDDTPKPPLPGCLAVDPSGMIELELVLGVTNDFAAFADVDVDISDNVLHALPALGGFTKLDNDGATLYSRPFGALVATDRDNNVFLTGMFDRAIDFGLGLDAPHGDGHAYLVKLDRSGNTRFAVELYPCGTFAVQSIAVDAPRSRVAVSGAGMGTLILDAADGHELFRLSIVGDVAFDSQGNILVAGESAGDAFIAKLDPTGDELFRLTFSDSTDPEHAAYAGLRQAGVGVTVDRDDNIIVIGEFEATIRLFGENFFIPAAGESGDNDGGFVLELSPTGALVWKRVQDALDLPDVAVDPLGNVVISLTTLGNLPPFTIPSVYKLDGATGATLWFHSDLPGAGYGAAGGLASDSCGNTFWAATVRPTFDFMSPATAYLLKLAL